jgi:hypothetical protein
MRAEVRKDIMKIGRSMILFAMLLCPGYLVAQQAQDGEIVAPANCNLVIDCMEAMVAMTNALARRNEAMRNEISELKDRLERSEKQIEELVSNGVKLGDNVSLRRRVNDSNPPRYNYITCRNKNEIEKECIWGSGPTYYEIQKLNP